MSSLDIELRESRLQAKEYLNLSNNITYNEGL